MVHIGSITCRIITWSMLYLLGGNRCLQKLVTKDVPHIRKFGTLVDLAFQTRMLPRLETRGDRNYEFWACYHRSPDFAALTVNLDRRRDHKLLPFHSRLRDTVMKFLGGDRLVFFMKTREGKPSMTLPSWINGIN